MVTAQIIADSQSPRSRLTTFLLTYPRFIHAEIMTHRSFSRNAASSRAIPISKMIATVKENPALPVLWGKNQSGMQARELVSDTVARQAKSRWLEAAESAISHANALHELGIHKQISNRLLEPFLHMTTLVTATDWENFFALRAHPDAQPEFTALAYAMLDAYVASTPRTVDYGTWHLPFGDRLPEGTPIEIALKVATARAARTSYVSFDAPVDIEKDIALHDRLAADGHWSPFEHCAQAIDSDAYSGNFRSWRQYRKTFENEVKSLSPEDLTALLSARPNWAR